MINPTTPNEKKHPKFNKPDTETTAQKRKRRSEAGLNPDRELRDLPKQENARYIVDQIGVLLLKGVRLSRLTLDEHGLTFNGSLHAYVPDAERKFEFPVARQKNEHTGVNDYWLEEDVRIAAANPVTRKVMAKQFRRQLEQKMLKSGIDRFERVLGRLELYPELLELHPWLEVLLRGLAKRIKTVLGD